MKFDLTKFDNLQIEVLNSYVDNGAVLKKLCSCIDHNYTPEQIEIIGKALTLGLDVTAILNSRLSSESMIILCDAIEKGIDVNGLDNVYVDSNLLKEIIKIRRISNFDMSFIRTLKLSQCLDFVNQFKRNPVFDLKIFLKNVQFESQKEKHEINYALDGYTK